jgi:hypothetical protein
MNVLSFDDVPFAQRNDTMFLSTVDSKCNVTALPPRRDPMYTDDIHGARPCHSTYCGLWTVHQQSA